jgi:hypothetical protein
MLVVRYTTEERVYDVVEKECAVDEQFIGFRR